MYPLSEQLPPEIQAAADVDTLSEQVPAEAHIAWVVFEVGLTEQVPIPAQAA